MYFNDNLILILFSTSSALPPSRPQQEAVGIALSFKELNFRARALMTWWVLLSIALLWLNLDIKEATAVGRTNPLETVATAKMSLQNPLQVYQGNKRIKELKQDANLPPLTTNPITKAYVGTPYFDVPRSKLKDGNVLIPCSECSKIVHRYISECAFLEGTLKPLRSLREFCEKSAASDPSFTDRDFEYCLYMVEKLASKTGTNFAALHTNNHALGSCATFQHICREHGGEPSCYSGFCDEMTDCIDCPYVSLQVAPGQPMHAEVCGDRGVCRIGSVKSNTGYCECDEGFRGLSCDQYRAPPEVPLP